MVYGDPQYRISSRVFLRNFKERVRRTRPSNADDLRALLIQAGQFEQGMADAGQNAAALTEVAAQAFSDALKGQTADMSRLSAIEEGPDVTLTIKIPEGYEFYALYPEQYIATAEAIAKERPNQRALVAGIRSIGTSLSAAVCATLKNSSRCTVRPHGDPFDRKVTLPALDVNSFHYAVIVDEGPGLSGSSIAAVWSALQHAGIKDIIVFPGHENGPGAAASAVIRADWQQMEKRFTPAQPLPGRDLSAGKWRELISGDWPPAFIPFERAKYLSEGGTFWKFAGLGAASENGKTAIENAWDRMQALAIEGFGPRPLEAQRGFIAMPWINGTPLTKSDARDPAVLDLLSQYVVRFAGLPLDPNEMRAGQERLAELTIANTREALGDKWARVAQHKLERGRELSMFQSYRDGRLAPHEWVRGSDGRIFKVDSFSHDADHTMIGKQSIVWDLAGLVLEWDLPEAPTADLLQSLVRQGVCLEPAVLQFHEIAYAAFRMGLCNFCGSQTTDPAEKTRLGAAEKSYCHKLLHLLNHE